MYGKNVVMLLGVALQTRASQLPMTHASNLEVLQLLKTTKASLDRTTLGSPRLLSRPATRQHIRSLLPLLFASPFGMAPFVGPSGCRSASHRHAVQSGRCNTTLRNVRLSASREEQEGRFSDTLGMLDELLDNDSVDALPDVKVTPAPAASSGEFDVLVFRSQKARFSDQNRWIFRSNVSAFKMPGAASEWSAEAREVWQSFQKSLMRAGMTKPVGGRRLPVLAMNGQTPCAAALYVEPTDFNDRTTFYLAGLIRNRGARCKGSGAAILCHLIRNSRNRANEFSPLQINPILEKAQSKAYFESFGCTTNQNWWSLFDEDLYCADPNPPKCETYRDQSFDADKWFRGFRLPLMR
eukprot:gnl/TRDRNA2_/TRDRNA2_145783_c0_seq1.p1 gnl/TRDRNA2_/TRDRNA2_145783_c0~~gnl/TRDRNA2_/TRDRNA2_145783_c0_seq1.p1  ORF type:complete len:353 (-),score=31.69 gnl/TRDRNA2_/TRDRNA2_145783_c0_seq1:38-1096(-)